MPISIKTVRAFAAQVPWAKLYGKTKNATKGQRLYPSKSHDKTKNFRLDKGATISDNQQEIILQANKDAENAEVKKSAQQNSHRILAKCVIDPDNVNAEQAQKDLEESFWSNN